MKLIKILVVATVSLVFTGLFVGTAMCNHGGKKAIEIIYTGRTWGQLRPCPS